TAPVVNEAFTDRAPTLLMLTDANVPPIEPSVNAPALSYVRLEVVPVVLALRLLKLLPDCVKVALPLPVFSVRVVPVSAPPVWPIVLLPLTVNTVLVPLMVPLVEMPPPLAVNCKVPVLNDAGTVTVPPAVTLIELNVPLPPTEAMLSPAAFVYKRLEFVPVVFALRLLTLLPALASDALPLPVLTVKFVPVMLPALWTMLPVP